MGSKPDAPLNHLAGERSLYLQQHAKNPLDWYPWCDAAFDLARANHRLILLSIGYSSCYWCHVMEDDVFSQEDVAAYMNQHYVCIKVDREERPDVDAAYMEAARVMTGSGGWPLNLWLTPDLRPVYAGTYFPKADFLNVSAQIAAAWQIDRAQFESVAGEVVKAVNVTSARGKPGKITRELIDRAAQTILMHTDPQWGGLASRVKFPEPVVWQFLLHHYARTRDPHMRRVLTLALDRMHDGGMYDHLGGGWHRYSTDPMWLVPHFEKMLYDNAQLASLYIDAARVLEDPRYAAVARDTLEFMLREMQLPGGGFAASIDASTSEGEGAYYVWTLEQLREIAGDDAEELARVLGVSEAPNFRDHHDKVSGSVVTRRAEDPGGLFAKYRPALLKARSERLAPVRDNKVVTAWNGLAITAFIKTHAICGDQEYLDAAREAAKFLMLKHYGNSEATLYRSSTDGMAGAPGILDDYVFLANAMLDLFSVEKIIQYEAWATALTRLISRFKHPGAGLYLEPEGTLSPFARRMVVSDTVEPSGNSVYLCARLKDGLLHGNLGHQQSVSDELEAFAGEMGANPLEMTNWLTAAELWLGPYYLVIVAGAPDAPDTWELIQAWRATPALNSLITLVPADGLAPELEQHWPTMSGKTAIDGKATAYVCTYGTCSAPVQDPVQLRELLLAR